MSLPTRLCGAGLTTNFDLPAEQGKEVLQPFTEKFVTYPRSNRDTLG